MRLRTREFYIPPGSRKVSDKASDAVAYVYERMSRRTGKMVPCYAVFFGKRAKPVAHFAAVSEADRESRIRLWFGKRQATLAQQAELSAERKAFRHTLKAGDILDTCWGYDQTNREWFEVTEVRGKFVIVREIAAERIETGWCQGYTAPLPGQYIGEALRRRVGQYGSIRIDDVRRAHLSDTEEVAGIRHVKPVHWTAYA